MLSPKLKWPRETSCIPNSTLQPIDDHRTRSSRVKRYRQVADLFLIQNENIIYSSVFNCYVYGQFWIFQHGINAN